MCCLHLQGADTVVVVEHRSGSADTYGQGHKVPMTLRDFITRMQQGDSKLYLSTQEVGATCGCDLLSSQLTLASCHAPASSTAAVRDSRAATEAA